MRVEAPAGQANISCSHRQCLRDSRCVVSDLYHVWHLLDDIRLSIKESVLADTVADPLGAQYQFFLPFASVIADMTKRAHQLCFPPVRRVSEPVYTSLILLDI